MGCTINAPSNLQHVTVSNESSGRVMKVSLVGLILNNPTTEKLFSQIFENEGKNVPAEEALDVCIQEYVNLRLGGTSRLVGESRFPEREFVVPELVKAREGLQRLLAWALIGGCRDSRFKTGYNTDVAQGVIDWADSGMTGPLPPLPDWLMEREEKADPGDQP
jgi:hypothetical protein